MGANYPNVTAANGRWLLKDVRDNAMGRTWPGAFRPALVNSNAAMWLDGADPSFMAPASDGTGAVSNNGPVKYWGDKTGSGRHLTNSGADSVCPTYITSYYNGRSAVSFDGGDVLSRASTGLQIAPSTCFIAFDDTAVVGFAGLLVGTPSSGDDYSGASRFITTVHEADYQIVRQSDSGVSPMVVKSSGLPNAAYGRHILSVVCSSSSASLRWDGVTQNTDAHSESGTSAGILLGGRYLGGSISGSYRFTGKMLEVIYYHAALTDAQTLEVERYLGGKWGVAVP